MGQSAGELVEKKVEGISYQKNNRGIKKESNQRVGNESHDTKRVNIVHSHAGDIGEESNDAVGDSAGGSVVVQGDEGVHLELGGAEQALDHDETQSLEDDATTLDEETKHVELDLAEGSDNDTNDNDGDIAKGLEVGRSNSKGPGGEESHDSVGSLYDQLLVYARFCVTSEGSSAYLQHLDEGNTEVEIGQVTADKRQAEHDTDGDNGTTIRDTSVSSNLPRSSPDTIYIVDYSRIGAGGHGDLVAGVQDGGELGQTLGHGSSEDHVPCCEEECCGSGISC
jgi:hypothetical protein